MDRNCKQDELRRNLHKRIVYNEKASFYFFRMTFLEAIKTDIQNSVRGKFKNEIRRNKKRI